MAEYIKLEFKNDPGHGKNMLRRSGTVYQYLLGGDGFDPGNKRDVLALVGELRRQGVEISNEAEVEHQLGRLSKDRIEGIHNIKID